MPTSLKLDAETLSEVEQLAQLKNQSKHSVMIESLKTSVRRELAKERFKQESRDSLQHYQSTGLHIGLDETNDWLDKVAQGDKTKAPLCHK